MPMFILVSGYGLELSPLCFACLLGREYKALSIKYKARRIKGEAADPRNRLPPSQLVSPLRKGGASEAREYIPHAPLLQAFWPSCRQHVCSVARVRVTA